VREVRISLQDKLSSQLDFLLTAESVKDYADAIDKLASFENLYVIVTALELVTGKEILAGTPNDAGDILDSVRNWWREDSVTRSLLARFAEPWVFPPFNIDAAPPEPGADQGDEPVYNTPSGEQAGV